MVINASIIFPESMATLFMFFLKQLTDLDLTKYQIFSIGDAPNYPSVGSECLVIIDRAVDMGYLLRTSPKDSLYLNPLVNVDGYNFKLVKEAILDYASNGELKHKLLDLTSENEDRDTDPYLNSTGKISNDLRLHRLLYSNYDAQIQLGLIQTKNSLDIISKMILANLYFTKNPSIFLSNIKDLLLDYIRTKTASSNTMFSVKDILCISTSFYAVLDCNNFDETMEYEIQKLLVQAMMIGSDEEKRSPVTKWVSKVLIQQRKLHSKRTEFFEFRNLIDLESENVYIPFVVKLVPSLLNQPESVTDLVYHESKSLIGGFSSFIKGTPHPSQFQSINLYFQRGITFSEIEYLEKEFKKTNVQLTIYSDVIATRDTLLQEVLKI